MKRRADAERAWGKAAVLFQDLEDRQKQGDTLIALGLMFKSGRRQEGLSTYQAGLALVERPHCSSGSIASCW